ncbi:helix-turn-helix domain-containing protein [Lentzea sp.]|uniref:helix-turn-helix domain-containing protein n=1 Tax=Lentzea sp. TaxID=56099 RepID=UPI002ED2B943
MDEIAIGEVVRRSGVPASTLRYYEERGLIAPVRRQGTARVFAPAVVEQLALIAVCRTAGFSLDDITLMFDPYGRPSSDRAMLAAKADELDVTIGKLVVMRDDLRHASVCPASSHAECQP